MNRGLLAATEGLGISATPEKFRAPHYLCLRRHAGIPKELPETLAGEKVFVSVRGSSMRVTPHVYNSERDVQKLITCLQRAMG